LELDGLRACLEMHTGRVVELVPAAMGPGALSGVCLRTARADYFYYEERTSRFHQAHIALCLAAQTLLGDGSGPAVDLLLVPDLRPELVRLMLGTAGSRPVPRREAETFAFVVMDRARSVGYAPPWAWRALRQLRPLHSALVQAIPEARSAADPGIGPGAGFRLYQQVIEIRDAVLALRPYLDPEAALTAERDGRAAGLTGEELAAAVDAAVLVLALRPKSAGEVVPGTGAAAPRVPLGGRDLRQEAACLVKVARAFAWQQRTGQMPSPRFLSASRASRRGCRDEARGAC